MSRKKNILQMIAIGVFWLIAVLIIEIISPASYSYYQLNPEDLKNVEQEIQQLRNKGISSKKFFSERAFIQELERVLGKKPDKKTQTMLVNSAKQTPFTQPKMMLVLPAILFVSATWFWLIKLVYPMSADRMKYLFWLGIIGGAISGQAAMITNGIIDEILGVTDSLSVWMHPFRMFFNYLFCAASEEFWKFLFCYLLIRRSKVFRSPKDGLVLAMIVGLGFATFENIGYVYQYNYPVLFIRGVLTVPAHLCFCGIWGYGMAEARFKRSRFSFSSEILPYLGLASVVHFIFNFFFASGIVFLFFFVLIMILTLILFFHNRLLQQVR